MASGRSKGGTNKYWTKEEKLKLVKEVVDEHKSTIEVSNRENISNGMFNNWIKNIISCIHKIIYCLHPSLLLSTFSLALHFYKSKLAQTFSLDKTYGGGV